MKLEIAPLALAHLAAPLLAGALAAGGCSSIGPSTVPRDRMEYSQSLSEAWQRQTLLNLVKLRYLEPPMFIDVGQIVSGYSIAVTTAAGLSLDLRGPADTLNLAASGTYTDRPTITYQPLTGNKFVKGLMTPIPPESVFQAIQGGWPLESLFRLSFRSINGIKNTEYTIKGASAANPDFERVLALLAKLNDSGMFALRVVPKPDKEQAIVLSIVSTEASPEIHATAEELCKLLGIDPKIAEYKLVQGNKNMGTDEIAVQTRSLLHILTFISGSVDVPDVHVEQGRAVPGFLPSAEGAERTRPLVVHSSQAVPVDASVTVRFREYYFYIDDRDLRSKRSFALLMLLFTLADTGEREPNPIVTIPAQ